MHRLVMDGSLRWRQLLFLVYLSSLLLLPLVVAQEEDGMMMNNTLNFFCTDTLLQQCEPCRDEFVGNGTTPPNTAYTCSLPGLSSLTPGMYEGISANYLSFVTETSSPNLPIRAQEFTACTGGTIVFAEAENVWEDPIADLGSKTSVGIELYDGYFMSYSHFPEASALGLAEHLNDRIRSANARLKWEDVYTKVRRMSEYRSNGETNIDFLMYDGDFFVPIIRLDLLERYNKSLPNTWLEVVELAKFFNGTDLNDDGVEDDFGFCHFPRLGAGYWDWWWTEAVYSTWATFDQTKGVDEGFFFDKETMEPRIDGNKGFSKAAEIWKELWINGADGCITDHFVTGRCAIGFGPPGCWKGVFLNPDGVSRKDPTTGEIIWRPTFANGEYAEPYRFKPFGSTEVVDRDTGDLVPCTRERCPNAEVIPPKGHMTLGDRANVTQPSPLEGQLINRAPFYWSGGLGTLIRASADDEKKDLLWDFFVYTNSAETSVYDVANYASWLDSWRTSQLFPGNNFLDAGWSYEAYSEHAYVMQWALSAESNGAMNLRLPGLVEYTRDSVGEHMSQYIQDDITLSQLATNINTDWIEITDTRGKLDQLTIYRSSLNLDSLSTFMLCELHRDDMDYVDPSVCRVFDETNTNTVLVAALVPSLLVVLVLGFLLFFSLRQKSMDSVWSIKREELIFDEPPEILGQGTFGLVLLAEYRGTQVAVKRVIPPKEVVAQKTASKEKATASTLVATVPSVQKEESQQRLRKDTSSGGDGHLSSFFDAPIVAEQHDPQRPRNARRRYSYTEGPVIANLPDNVGEMYGSDEDLENPRTRPPVRRQSLGSVASYQSSIGSASVSTGDMHVLNEDINEEKVGTSMGSVSVLFASGGYASAFVSTREELNRESKWELKSPFRKGKRKLLLEEFTKEMRQLSTLRHPSIVSVMGAVIERGKEPMLVLEFMDLGSLYDLLHNISFPLEGGNILAILRDIAQGVHFLHAADPEVIHGDIKAQNILVDSRFRAKVADFGLSQKRKVGGSSFAAGTPLWMAPELLRGESGNTSNSDVYSFGVLLFEVYSRSEPYEGEDVAAVLKAVSNKDEQKRPAIPKSTPPLISSLMVDCFNEDPNLRPSVQEVDIRLRRLEAENVTPTEIDHPHYKRKGRGEELLYDMFPKHVADALSEGRKVEPEKKELVTIFFSDIVGFTTISSEITVEKVSDMLDRLYLALDDAADRHDVFKIETIGDAYMCVTNLVKDQSDDHTKRMSLFALEAMKIASNTPIDLDDPSRGTIKLRAGFHSGPVIASVIGSRNLKYSIFGDAVNTASRMESTSEHGKIQISDKTARILQVQYPGANLVSRGMVAVKGKGEMKTFFLKPTRKKARRYSK